VTHLWFWLAAATLASYRLTRLVIVDDIFNTPRDAVYGWLLRGESAAAHRVGKGLVCGAALAAWALVVARIAHFAISDADGFSNAALAWGLAACLALFLVGAVVGYRYKVQEGLECRWCVSVWTSAAVAASLSLWGHWPIVPTCVFAGATAGLQCFLNLGEDLLAAVLEGFDDADA
jgi:hypothetical protein